MDKLYIKKSDDNGAPKVNFDHEHGICELEGNSYMESPQTFYSPLKKWITDYSLNHNDPLQVKFKLTYYNTGSSRQILELLKIIQVLENTGNKISVYWYVNEFDIDLEDDIEDLMTESNVRIKIIKLYEDLNPKKEPNSKPEKKKSKKPFFSRIYFN